MTGFNLSNPAFVRSVDESSIVTNGLVLYYSAANRKSYMYPDLYWKDLSGRGNNGQFVGSVSFQYTNGGVMSFNGSTGCVLIGTPAPLAGHQVPLTITGFFNQTVVSTYNTIYSAYSDYAVNKLWSIVRLDSGEFFYYVSQNGGVFQVYDTNYSPTPNSWHFFAVVMSGTIASSTCTIYIDRAFLGSQNFSALSSTPDVTAQIYIGKSQAYGEYFQGGISDFQVYNRALSSTEVYRNYDAQKTRLGLK